MTPAIPFIYEILLFLVSALNPIGMFFARSLIHNYHTLPFIFFIATLVLRRSYSIVNGNTNLHVFIITLILSNATIKMFPALITPPCNMSIVNLHAYSFLDRSSISIISLYEIFSFDRREYSSLANVTFSGLYGFINLLGFTFFFSLSTISLSTKLTPKTSSA